MDLHLDLIIWQLADVQQMLGACITTQLGSTAAGFRTLLALMKLRDAPEELLSKVRSYEGSTVRIISKRNRVVHDTWIFDWEADSGMQVQVAVEKQLKMGLIPIDLNELTKTQNEIANARKQGTPAG